MIYMDVVMWTLSIMECSPMGIGAMSGIALYLYPYLTQGT
jgi:hypothetical protein